MTLARADRPLVFAHLPSISLGLLSRRQTKTDAIVLSDAGGGAGTWTVRREGALPAGVSFSLPGTVEVPGDLVYDVTVSPAARQGDVTGYILLRREGAERRIPYWGRVTVPRLARHEPLELRRAGVHRGTTAGKPALVTRYRYPDDPGGLGVTTFLRGPEAVYRFRLTRAAKNFGVVVTGQPQGSRVEPRVVAGLDENRLTGYAGLPVHHNPYLEGFQRPLLAAGRPLAAARASTPSCSTARRAAGAGRFTFRFWIDDVTPPTLLLRNRLVKRGDPLRVAATDAGSGIYGQSIRAAVDGGSTSATFARGNRSRSHRRPGAWQASTPTACLRLPGDEEHRERGAHPSEHTHADGDLHVRER